MRPVAVVTSCSAAGWKQYGQRFVETFEAFCPGSVRLLYYSEDAAPAWLPSRVEFYPLFIESPACDDFIARHRDDLLAHGRKQTAGQSGWTPNKIAQGYNFRYDAARFSKKVFSIEAAARRVSGGRLFWLDADVVTFERVPIELFERMLPAGAALCCLDRDSYHSECGFVGYDLERPETRDFIRRFALTYASDAVFGLGEWHDSWVFDWLRRQTGIATHAIPHCSRHQPFINSELGRYMDHMKGASKTLGKTPRRHMLAGHEHPYWRGAEPGSEFRVPSSGFQVPSSEP